MTVILRNNIEVEDQRLDRIQQFDERSREFPIRSLLQAKTPRSYTWRCNEWYDQGREGACVAYSLGHELAARPAEVRGINDKWLVQNVYWEAQKIDPWSGGSYPGAKPFYEGTSILAGVKILHKKKLFETYRWAFNLNDVLLGVSHNGPAVIGVNWYTGMFFPDSKGYIKPTGSLAGGHAVLVRGVNMKKQHVVIRNSWGKNWGVNGDCYLSFDDLGRLLSERGEAVFMVKRTAMFHEATFG
jgi:hypothetical protein